MPRRDGTGPNGSGGGRGIGRQCGNGTGGGKGCQSRNGAGNNGSST